MMKDRLITFGGALLALYIVFLLVFPQQEPTLARPSFPITNDTGKSGLSVLYQWLQGADIPVISWRQRYSGLIDHEGIAGNGNLLLISEPQRIPSRLKEQDHLREWVEQGNNVLILAAMNDMSLGSMADLFDDRSSVLGALGFNLNKVEAEGLSGAELDSEFDADPDYGPDQSDQADQSGQSKQRGMFDENDLFRAEELNLKVTAWHPVTEGVDTIHASYYLPSNPSGPMQWEIAGSDERRLSLVLLEDELNRYPALWELAVGEGRVWVSAYGGLMNNASIGFDDNARLMANLIAVSLSKGGTVMFDDMHQGLSDLYDPDAFFGDSRLHNTLLVILIVWLLYVVGRSNRLAPPTRQTASARAIDFVLVTAGLLSRRLDKRIVGQTLFANFFNDIRLQYGLAINGQPTWDILEGLPRVDTRDLQRLKTCYDRLDTKRKQNLVEIVNLIHDIRGYLL